MSMNGVEKKRDKMRFRVLEKERIERERKELTIFYYGRSPLSEKEPQHPKRNPGPFHFSGRRAWFAADFLPPYTSSFLSLCWTPTHWLLAASLQPCFFLWVIPFLLSLRWAVRLLKRTLLCLLRLWHRKS